MSPWFHSVWTLCGLSSAVGGCLLAGISRAAEIPNEEDYNQWKKALGTNSATAASNLVALSGFSVELLRSAQPGEGSWVALAVDPKGRIVIAPEEKGLLRVTLSPTNAQATRVEVINTNLLECRGLLFAHDALYANANNSKGLYRLRDTDGDDQFDEVKLLQATPGGVGHGRNQLALGPDGLIYSIHGDDVGLPTNGVAADSPLRHYAEDRLLPCEWDKHLFNASARMPLGHLIRTDRDAKKWELIAGGLRNPFGIAFNEAGDLFTYDADMEWDVGMPWYHPTRVLHLVPGGDYGWRRGTGVLPAWSPDTLPSVVDIGLGSPTAIQFGTKSRFPEPWRSALFILEWSYGKIYAVHFSPTGATYTARAEVFLKGRPLNVTGLDFGPDGALYFVTGGRRTQSGLYRVRWTGAEPPAVPPAKAPGATPKIPSSVNWLRSGDVWAGLSDADAWRRHSARVTLETLPVADWSDRALQETKPIPGLTALLALSRVGAPALQPAIFKRIHELAKAAADQMTAEQQLLALRALGVCALRMTKPTPEQFADSLQVWEPRFPTADARVNQALCEWLVFSGSTNVLRKTLPRLDKPISQEEKLHYLFTLRLVKSGWSLAERRSFFTWLGRARREFQGASMLPTALNYIRSEVEPLLTAAERSALADVFAALDAPVVSSTAAPAARKVVKEWTMADFSNSASANPKPPDLARGRGLFASAGCVQCHRMGREGGLSGPDLTGVGSRFDRRALLESILEPSKVIAEVYRNVVIVTKSGAIFEGRVMSEDAQSLFLATNPIDPIDQRTTIKKGDITSQRVSEVSPMPAGLANTLEREELLDLVAFLEKGVEAP